VSFTLLFLVLLDVLVTDIFPLPTSIHRIPDSVGSGVKDHFKCEGAHKDRSQKDSISPEDRTGADGQLKWDMGTDGRVLACIFERQTAAWDFY